MSKARTIADLGGGVPDPFNPVAVTGATPSLDVGSYNFFNNGTITANTTVSFASVPTNAKWSSSPFVIMLGRRTHMFQPGAHLIPSPSTYIICAIYFALCARKPTPPMVGFKGC